MAYFDDNADVLLFTCPGCGATHRIVLPVRMAELSTVAYAVLTARGVSQTEQDALKEWRAGKPISTRMMARIVGYSARHTRRGMAELVRVGYAVPVQHACGVQFAGVPTLMNRVASIAA